MSYLELFWALSNGEFVRGRYLSSTDLSPLRTHYFASLKMSGISITYSGYWYPPSPDNSPHNKTQNLHSEPIHLECSIQAMLPSNNSILIQYGSSSFQKKTGAEAMKKNKRDKTHTSTQKSWNKVLKRPKFSKCESISSLSPENSTFHKIGIWLSTNLLRTTLRLGNTGNQGMLHSSYPKLHISALD